MSSPTTPSRQRATPSRSPSSDPTADFRNNAPMELTPRSKVQALMAELDDSEDEGLSVTTTNVQAAENALPKRATPVPDADVHSASDAESSSPKSAVPKVPRGRLLARILGKPAAATTQRTTSPNPQSNNPVQQSIFGEPEPTAECAKQDQLRHELPAAASSEEDDIPLPKRRLARKTQRSSNNTSLSTTPYKTNKFTHSSPGLFVSPSPDVFQTAQENSAPDSQSDSPVPHSSNHRLQQLFEKKRAEMRAKEAKDKIKKKARQQRLRKDQNDLQNTISSEYDDPEDAGELVAKKSRPLRKATKKALEEMNRETQRMSRNQLLAHQAKVRKHFTKSDLFSAFNFNPDGSAPAPEMPASEQSEQHVPSTFKAPTFRMPPALISSDAMAPHETPPSSPPSCDPKSGTDVREVEDEYLVTTDHLIVDNDEDLPTVQEIRQEAAEMKSQQLEAARAEDDGKFRNDDVKNSCNSIREAKKKMGKRPMSSIRALVARTATKDSDSEDDLEIVPTAKPDPLAIFDKVPRKHGTETSYIKFRALANMGSPTKMMSRKKGNLSRAQVNVKLLERSREQARKDREERLNELRAKGFYIETEEEKQKHRKEIEDMLEQARQRDLDLAEREKQAAKKEGKRDDNDSVASSDEEEWIEGDESEAEGYSGSEEEEDQEETGSDGSDEEDAAPNPFIKAEAEDDDDTSDDLDRLLSLGASATSKKQAQKSKNRFVVMDDEDDEDDDRAGQHDKETTKQSPDYAAAFGFKIPQGNRLTQMFAGTMAEVETPPSKKPEVDSGYSFKKHPDSSLSMTQLFAGTMADLESQNNKPEKTQDLGLEFLRKMPTSTAPEFGSPGIIQDSQPSRQATSNIATFTPKFGLGLSQIPSQSVAAYSPTKAEAIPDPTPDAGFDTKNIDDYPHSTIDTLPLDVDDSPLLQRKGRLRRNGDKNIAAFSDDDSETSSGEDAGGNDAFSVLFKGAKKSTDAAEFDKKKSAAKKLVEEQAEESEDEYAGLGGASDEESDGEAEQELKDMLDDQQVDVDESEIAALFADKSRKDDEKQIDKLYRDLTTGMLRRKRGAGGMDGLSDDDDWFDIADQRRRKREEFARMRRALMADENVGKIAENPKKAAFLKAIEDRDDEEDGDAFDYLEEEGLAVSVPDSQAGEAPDGKQQQQRVESARLSTNAIKRKLPGDFALATDFPKENVPPPNAQIHQAVSIPFPKPSNPRRTALDPTRQRPTTLEEIRRNVSSLIDEPFLVPDSQPGVLSSGEETEGDAEAEISFAAATESWTSFSTTTATTSSKQSAATTTKARKNNTAVVNRLHQRQAATAAAAAAAVNQPRLTSFFSKRPPPLARRVTDLSNASASTSTTSSGRNTPVGEKGGSGGLLRKGGSGKSSIHYQAREAERQKAVRAGVRKVEERVRRRVVGKAGKSALLGGLGSQGWE